jgi:hypothetical protein
MVSRKKIGLAEVRSSLDTGDSIPPSDSLPEGREGGSAMTEAPPGGP